MEKKSFQFESIIAQSKAMCKQVLEMKPVVQEQLAQVLDMYGKPIEFDYSMDAPSIASGSFDDDLTDAYITKIWIESGVVKVDLYAYYIADDRFGRELARELVGAEEYADILDYVIGAIEEDLKD